jgi:hypothetical protein
VNWAGHRAYRPTEEIINRYEVLPGDPEGNRTLGRLMRILGIILKYTLNKQTPRAWNRSYGSKQKQLPDCQEHGNEPSCSLKYGDFPGLLEDC